MLATTIPAIERQLDFRATPERLWRALTDDAELSAWFGQGAHLDLRPGGGRLVRVGRARPRAGSHGDRGAGDAAGVAVGRRRQVGRRRLDARRVPARAPGSRRDAPLPARVGLLRRRRRAGATPRAGSRSSRSSRRTSRPSRSRPASGGPTRSRRRSIGCGQPSPNRPSSPPGGPRGAGRDPCRLRKARGSGRARAAGSRTASRPWRRRATSAGPGSGHPTSRSRTRTRCCAPSGSSSRARTAAPTCISSRPASADRTRSARTRAAGSR